MNIDNAYNVKQVVYLKTDVEQLERIVTAIVVNAYDVTYRIVCGATVSEHYDFELSESRRIF